MGDPLGEQSLVFDLGLEFWSLAFSLAESQIKERALGWSLPRFKPNIRRLFMQISASRFSAPWQTVSRGLAHV